MIDTLLIFWEGVFIATQLYLAFMKDPPLMNKRLPVTVLSGFLGAGKTTVLSHVLNNQEGLRVAVIVNDMSELNIDAKLIEQGNLGLSRKEASLVEMSNGCICCTLREDLLIEVARLAKEDRFDYLLVESTGISEPMPVAETFTFADEEGQSLSDLAQLDTLVTVVDASTFRKEVEQAMDLRDRGLALNEEDDRTVGDLLIDQVECANVIIVNKTDLVTPEELQTLEALITALNPEATLVQTQEGVVATGAILNTGLFDPEKMAEAPGWLKTLRGEETPESDTYGISSFLYQARKPFHPQRFRAWLMARWDGVLRSKGYFWVASRMDYSLQWSQAGAACRIEPGAAWFAALPEEEWPQEPEERASILAEWHKPYGDRHQALVFIGQSMDEAAIRAALDACLLDEAEMLAGPVAWATYEDSFPQYVIDNGEEEEEEVETERILVSSLG
jgi:G3E family GTPase